MALMEQFHAVMDRSLPTITEDSMPGELANIVSGRIANIFNLRGPNFITDAACASSFAAVEAAVELLTEHKVDAVLTGGVDRNMGASTFVKFCKIGALSATGTRPFGDGADGFVMGEGAGAFLLKRLEDAERAGDTIYAVIRGVAGSSDGKGKGITAPNPIGQQLAGAARLGSGRARPGHGHPGRGPWHQHPRRRRGRGGKPGHDVWRRAARQHRPRLGQEQHRPPEGRGGRGRAAEDGPGAAPQNPAADAQRRPGQPQH
jgi:3-oxoacyl-(acyl-carrier-protein) synthase